MIFACLLSVKDINKARAFYEEIFDLKVDADFGINVGFDCGLALQQDFSWLTGIPSEEIKDRENSFEVYFEMQDFDEFVAKLKGRDDIRLLHDVKEHGWGQRVIRFYDLDNHLIEVGESMKSVIEKFMDQGMTLEEVAKRIDGTVMDVENMLRAAE
ncbi:VOC family protein [Emergencia timonensis]|uniref:VOC family protein n=1 Tax=Emergencia timonensis TaxID=1776384 RepID=UPI0039958E63